MKHPLHPLVDVNGIKLAVDVASHDGATRENVADNPFLLNDEASYVKTNRTLWQTKLLADVNVSVSKEGMASRA